MTKQRWEPSPNGFRSSAALCCVSFSLACRQDRPQTNSGCARGTGSSAFTFSPGPTAPSPVGAHFISDSPSSNRRWWQASGRRGLRFRSIGSYSTYRPTTSLHRAKAVPASERLALSGCAWALHRPSSYCVDSTRHRRGHTCCPSTWYPPSRGTSACQHPSRPPRDAVCLSVCLSVGLTV